MTVDELHVRYVRAIFDSVLVALQANPARKFSCVGRRGDEDRARARPLIRRSAPLAARSRSYVEMAYLARYWNDSSVGAADCACPALPLRATSVPARACRLLLARRDDLAVLSVAVTVLLLPSMIMMMIAAYS